MKLPKFVKLDNIALRLRDYKYYRDGVLLSWHPKMKTLWLHKQPLIEITEEE